MVKTKRKIKYQKRAQNRFSMALATAVMVAIVGGVLVKGLQLRTQLKEYEETKAQLQEQIDAEELRTQELEEYSKYTQTDEYVEKVARDKLGLVKKGEIVFHNTGESSSDTTSGSTAGSSSDAASAAASDTTSETTSETAATSESSQDMTASGTTADSTAADGTAADADESGVGGQTTAAEDSSADGSAGVTQEAEEAAADETASSEEAVGP